MTIRHLPEPELCCRLIDGDEQAFRNVFDRFHRKIYQFAFNFLKNKVHSEEIVQHTFIQFWLHRETLNPSKPIAPLLFTIARRSMVDTWRRTARSEQFRQHVALFMESVGDDTEERMLLDDLERVTNDALSLLNQQQQKVFRLSRYEGRSYDEIAEQLHISKNTVKYHLVNALKIVKAHLNKHGIGYILLVFFW